MLEGQEALSSFMEESGFIRIGAYDFQYTRDVIFIKDLLKSLIMVEILMFHHQDLIDHKFRFPKHIIKG